MYGDDQFHRREKAFNPFNSVAFREMSYCCRECTGYLKVTAVILINARALAHIRTLCSTVILNYPYNTEKRLSSVRLILSSSPPSFPVSVYSRRDVDLIADDSVPAAVTESTDLNNDAFFFTVIRDPIDHVLAGGVTYMGAGLMNIILYVLDRLEVSHWIHRNIMKRRW